MTTEKQAARAGSRWIRIGSSALAILLMLVIMFVGYTAWGTPYGCGLGYAVFAGFIFMILGLPLTLIAVIAAATLGYLFPRGTLFVQTALIVLGLAVIGIFQTLRYDYNYHYESNYTRCRIDF